MTTKVYFIKLLKFVRFSTGYDVVSSWTCFVPNQGRTVYIFGPYANKLLKTSLYGLLNLNSLLRSLSYSERSYSNRGFQNIQYVIQQSLNLLISISQYPEVTYRYTQEKDDCTVTLFIYLNNILQVSTSWNVEIIKLNESVLQLFYRIFKSPTVNNWRSLS